jgi:serine/threonine-protein kinase
MVQSGQRVGEYVLDERIGGGAFGEVWRAHHHAWVNDLVAVKIPSDPTLVRALQAEGHAVHGLSHPGIARPIGFDPFAPVPYLVTEYVPGTNLRTFIDGRTLQTVDTVAILSCVLDALAFAHSRGIVHRDVKPENVLIHQDAASQGFAAEGMVKLTDFGLGQRASAATAGSIVLSMDQPLQKELAGSLDYMSPEQRRGDGVDARADVYACGVMLFEMLTGQRPSGTEVPSDLSPGVSKPLDEVFRRSYARLEKRYGSATEMREALQSAAKSRAAPPPMPVSADRGVGPARPAPLSCPRCGRRPSPGDQFCIHCGQQLVPEVRRCGECGFYPDPSDRYCLHCGHALPAPVRLA